MIKQQLNDDVKAAMIAGEKADLETLRGLKSVILYAEVAAGKREEGLSDDEILVLFAKEAKKREESAQLYDQGDSPERAAKERSEKELIESYLPAQLSEAELVAIIDEVMAGIETTGNQAMGQIIGAVKQRAGTTADGSLIARLVKEKLA